LQQKRALLRRAFLPWWAMRARRVKPTAWYAVGSQSGEARVSEAASEPGS